MRVAPKIILNGEDRQTLDRWARGRSTPARLVLRAQIVLLAAEGKENKDIAQTLRTDRLLVGKWRRRFAEKGLAGIEKDAPRGGRKPRAREAMAAKIIQWTTQKKPAMPNAHGSAAASERQLNHPAMSAQAAVRSRCPQNCPQRRVTNRNSSESSSIESSPATSAFIGTYAQNLFSPTNGEGV